MEKLKAICPLNFFEDGGIKKLLSDIATQTLTLLQSEMAKFGHSECSSVKANADQLR